ncbi:unnamed protein product [Allacma fusca]|uniref:RING-type domain-containing protein n=1 Tax=Allacma fusca TaxID=39272 RepID=A0A8J2KCI3_9HEXA|nr:unnamed protein product [Allacma fusca]
MAATEQYLSTQINRCSTEYSCNSDTMLKTYGKSAAISRSDTNCNYLDGCQDRDFETDYSQIKEILEEYRCPICMEILVNTSVISCGHRFCLYCIKQWFHHSHPKRFCPVCRKNCVYYQDDGDTDINISNLFRCLPVSEQEERNVVMLDREYASGIPNTRLPPQQNLYFGVVDELSQPWASQFTSGSDVAGNPFEPLNPIMAENYYPSFLPYLSYEPPFSELEYHERSVSAPVLPSQTNPDGSLSYQQGSADSYLNSIPITCSSLEVVTNADLTYTTGCNAGYMQRPSQPLRVSSFGGFSANEVYSSENLELDNLIGNSCPVSYGPLQIPGETLGNAHYGSSLSQSAPPVNLDYSTDPPSLIPLWNQNFSDQSPNMYNSVLPVFDSVNHPTAEQYKQACVAFGGGRGMNPVSDQREIYRLPKAPSAGWNSEAPGSEHVQLSNDWQLTGSQQVDSNWDLPSLSNISETNLEHLSNLASDGNRSKFSRRSTNPPNTTHEDYQQDMLIQEEFQRLDEMLLRDDDDLCISENDQVSVESVVSSEQQYDSPWEVPSNQARSKEGKGVSAGNTAEQQSQFTVPRTTSSSYNANRLSVATSNAAIKPVTVEEFQRNLEQRVDMQFGSGNRIHEKKLASQGFINSVKKFPVPPATAEPKGFRPKIVTKPTLDARRFQSLDSQQRCCEQKRALERHRTEEIRLNDRPSVIPNKSMDLGLPAVEFRQGPLTTRRTTPRLPKMRADQRTKKVLSLKKKPPTRPSTPGLPEAIAPNNMMGVSHGDGIWGAVPEMNANMYLPYGMLLFKMEYQPHGNMFNSFSSASAAKHQQQHHPPQNVTNLVKFTHPVIHMLPLSSDGSTRLNITFDVVYQT